MEELEFDEDFGPKIDLASRIREILQIYPEVHCCTRGSLH